MTKTGKKTAPKAQTKTELQRQKHLEACKKYRAKKKLQAAQAKAATEAKLEAQAKRIEAHRQRQRARRLLETERASKQGKASSGNPALRFVSTPQAETEAEQAQKGIEEACRRTGKTRAQILALCFRFAVRRFKLEKELSEALAFPFDPQALWGEAGAFIAKVVEAQEAKKRKAKTSAGKKGGNTSKRKPSKN